MQPECAHLRYIDERSDKVYNVDLIHNTLQGMNGWAVEIGYGRRGAALNVSQKVSEQPYEAAKKVFDKVVKGKLAKGYKLTSEGSPMTKFVAPDLTGLQPQLANSMSWDDITDLLVTWDSMYFQEKYDGERRMVRLGDEITCSNRRGIATSTDPTIMKGLEMLAQVYPGWILDCEDMGSYLVVFDVVDPKTVFEVRNLRLQALDDTVEELELEGSISVAVASHIKGLGELEDLRDLYQEWNCEGMILRNGEAKYVPGRPNTGGDLIKFKFTASATCQVQLHNHGKRSVALGMRTEDGGVLVGNVTIPPNHEIPEIEALVEIEYLYAYKGGSLYQPVYKGLRTDLTEADRYGSLKFKGK